MSGYKEAAISYFATAYVLFGGFLAYSIYAQTLRDIDVFIALLGFVAAPAIALCGGVFVFATGLAGGNLPVALFGLAMSMGVYGIWRGVWYALYGRKRRFSQTVSVVKK